MIELFFHKVNYVLLTRPAQIGWTLLISGKQTVIVGKY